MSMTDDRSQKRNEIKFSCKHLILGDEVIKEKCWVSRLEKEEHIEVPGQPKNSAAGEALICLRHPGSVSDSWQSDTYPLFDNILGGKGG